MKYLKHGLDEKTIKYISEKKEEPEWMLDYRLRSFQKFLKLSLPKWGPDLNNIDFNKVIYYASSDKNMNNDWNDVPKEIKEQFDELGIPEHERSLLAGVSTQYESEIIYHKLNQRFDSTGIIFDSIENGLKKYPKIFKKYFGKLVNFGENKFTALNGAVWSGGSFVYVPKNVKLDFPIETYFRINADNMGQFERTLIIADENSQVHYIEGCTAPQFLRSSLHSAVVEIYALKNAKVKYTTLQNWSRNVYNLVTKRSLAEENASIEWLDVNIGSKVTMKYPTVLLNGKNAYGSVNSIALSEKDQNIDSGAKMLHNAPNTRSLINSTTICQSNGIATFRGKVDISKNAKNSSSFISCNNVQLSKVSVSKAYPTLVVNNDSSTVEHEALASNISRSMFDYFFSRGIDENKAREMILSGYFSEYTNQLPLEYAIELERIIHLFNEKYEKDRNKK